MTHGEIVAEAREYLADRRLPTPRAHALVVALDELAIENASLKEANGHLHQQTNKLGAEILKLRAEIVELRSANSSLAEKGLCRAHVDPLNCEMAPCNYCIYYMTAERDKLRAEVAAKEKFVKDAIAACSNAGRLRELLREARPYLNGFGWGKPGVDLPDRIDAALSGRIENE